MSFRTNAAPYQRTKKSTLQIMLILMIALAIVWICAVVYSFKLGTNYGIKAILMVLVAAVTTAASDILTTIIKHKKGKEALGKEIVHDLIHNYSYVTSLIFVLTLPVYVSYYVVIVGAIFATVVVKNFFGGFGKNIFNPAIMARIFVGLCFVGQFSVPETLLTAGTGIDAITGATLTTAFNNQSSWLASSVFANGQTIKGAIFADYTMLDVLSGNYVGALGETFTIVIFVLGIALSILKVINWRTPVFYLGTVAITSLAIALILGFSNPFSYVIYQLSLGGLMFGAVFMLTDPVTGPTAPFGKSLIGVIAGLLTVLIRVKGGYPEGVMFSIAICNLISPAIDYFTVGKTTANSIKKYSFVFGTLLVSVVLCSVIAFKVNGGKESYSIGNMDIAQENLIHEYITVDEGCYFQIADDYVAKTDKVVDYTADPSKPVKKVHYLHNANDEKIGIVYTVKDSFEIERKMDGESYGAETVTAYMLAAFDFNGNLLSVGFIKPANTKGYGQESAFAEYASSFAGSQAEINAKIAEAENYGGASYSPAFIRQLIQDACAEYNASMGD